MRDPHLRRVFIAMFLAAFNLRPAITSLSTLLDNVRTDLGLSASTTGLLVMLPVLCFGVFALLAPRLLRRIGADRIVLLGLVALAAGLALRSTLGAFGMFAGTLASGAAISITLVALPSIIKREYGTRAGPVMGFYSMSLCLGAAAGAGLTVPLQDLMQGNWQLALAFWLVPAAGAALLWLRPATRTLTATSGAAAARHQGGKAAADAAQGRTAAHAANAARHDAHAGNTPIATPDAPFPPGYSILRDPLAWMVTLYMGLQSFLNYCAMTWMPAMLNDRGMTQLEAGFGLSISIAVQLITSLIAPWIGSLGTDQRLSISLMLALTLSGMLGILYAPAQWLWPAIIVTGLGQGGTFSMALTLLVLRSPTPGAAAMLSGMAQGIGYAVAALGPFSMGVLHAASGNWHSSALLMCGITVAAWLCGMRAGRNRLIGPQPADARA